MRRMQSNKKFYRVNRSGMKILTRMMLFLSLVIVIAGLLSKAGRNGAFTVSPSVTAAPTPIGAAFDETAESREITVPQSGWFALQLGAFENEESAMAQAQAYQGRGAAGYILYDNARYRVLASVYTTREDAQAVRGQLKNNHEIESYIYEIPISELKIKISGMKGQIDVIDACLQFLNDGTVEMQKLSVLLDEKQANRDSVANDLNALSTRAGELAQLFSWRFTAPKHAMVQALEAVLAIYTQLPAQLMAEDKGDVALATALKYETIRLIDATARAVNTLRQ